MKALITGATGFCGTHLRQYLESQGVEAIGLPRPANPGDVSSLTAVLRSVAPDYVFHLAGIVHAATPVEFYRVNTLYASTLLQALAESGHAQTPIILAGTAAEYGIPAAEQLPLTEDAHPRPFNHYGTSKLAQSLLSITVAKTEKRPIVVTRPFNVIGPGMPSHLAIQSFAEQIGAVKRGERTPVMETGNLDSQRDFIDIADVVRIYWDLIRNPAAHGEIVNVCTGQGTKISNLLHQLIVHAGIDIQIRNDPARQRGSDASVHIGSTSKLASLVDTLAFTPLETTLQKICRTQGF